jgi:hypothetical protein
VRVSWRRVRVYAAASLLALVMCSLSHAQENQPLGTKHRPMIERNDSPVRVPPVQLTLRPAADEQQETSAQPSQTLVTGEVWVLADGTMHGTTRTKTAGAAAGRMRSFMADIEKEGANTAAIQLLRRQNMEGYAHITFISEQEEDHPVMDISFVLNNRQEKDGSLRVPSHGGPRLARMVQPKYVQALRERMIPPDLCAMENYEQKIVMHLPPAITLEPASLPDMRVDVPFARFNASYHRDGDVLTLMRSLSVQLDGKACTLDAILDMAPAFRAAAREFNRILLIKPLQQ